MNPDCGCWPGHHPQQHVQYGDLAGCVDEKIADLILAMWHAGIATSSSCQDFGDPTGATPDPRLPPNTVFVSLPVADFERLLNLVVADEDDPLDGLIWDEDPGLIPCWDGERFKLEAALVLTPPAASLLWERLR